MKTMNKIIMMAFTAILMSQLFSSCAVYSIDGGVRGGNGKVSGGVRVGVNTGVGFMKFNYWDQYQPPVWDQYSREYYHLGYNYTIQRTSATTWQIWTRQEGRLNPFGQQILDFNIYQALEKAKYMKGHNLKVTYFHPSLFGGYFVYDVIVNGDRFMISASGLIFREDPYQVYNGPAQKFFLPEGKWVNNQY